MKKPELPTRLARSGASALARILPVLVLLALAAPEVSAQLPRSRFLEPQRSTFRPSPGERNPFTPVRAASSDAGGGGLGILQPSLGSSTPARYLPPAKSAETKPLISGDSFRLSGVLLDDKTPLAVIDGHSYTLGDKVPFEMSGIALEFTVSAIEDRQVTLTCQEVTVVAKMKGSAGD